MPQSNSYTLQFDKHPKEAQPCTDHPSPSSAVTTATSLKPLPHNWQPFSLMMPPNHLLPYYQTLHIYSIYSTPDIFKTPETQNYTDVSIETKLALSQLYQHIPTNATNHDTTIAPSYLLN